MTRKQIDAMRERRLWLGQVILPAITAGVTIMGNDNIRGYVTNCYCATKNKICDIFKKENMK